MRFFPRPKAHVPAPRWRPRLLVLEDRCVPSTLQVTSPLDDGSAQTLRYAVAHAGTGDKIVLKGGALGGIVLTQGELLLNQKNLTIQTSSDQARATVSGGGVSRVFEVAAGGRVTLNNLTVAAGNAQTGNANDPHEGRGGGIVVDEGSALTMTGCTVTNNIAAPISNPTPDDPNHLAGGLGGGIADYGTLTMANCSVTNNQAQYTFGGGIAVFSGAPFSDPLSASLAIRDSTVSGNTANENGGGICGVASTVKVDNCDVTGNTASLYFGGGLNNHGGTMTISHSRVNGNVAKWLGGGVTSDLAAPDGTSTLTITDSDVSGNVANSGAGIDSAGTFTLRDSTVTNNATRLYGFGGGIYIPTGTATLRNDVLTGNHADLGGGVASWGSLVVSDCQLTRNSARSSAGAVSSFGDMTLIHSVLSDNSAYGSGAIECGGTTAIRDCDISDNTALGQGGAIGAYGGTTTIRNSVLAHNSAGYAGGAVDSEFGTLVVRDSVLSGNTADNGGAAYVNSSTDAFTNCVLSDNTATYAGGAIADVFGTLSLSRSVVTRNSADTGGGIFQSYGTLTISDFTTISGNTAVTAGGGLYLGASAATVTVSKFSRVVDNTAPAGSGMDVYIQPKFSDYDPDVTLNLQGFSQLGDVSNGGILYRDAGSTIDHLDGNPVIPL
jgi:hypothetical protein